MLLFTFITSGENTTCLSLTIGIPVAKSKGLPEIPYAYIQAIYEKNAKPSDLAVIPWWLRVPLNSAKTVTCHASFSGRVLDKATASKWQFCHLRHWCVPFLIKKWLWLQVYIYIYTRKYLKIYVYKHVNIYIYKYVNIPISKYLYI